ncbi:uncharacterized protein ACJ7VT_021790 [Polymixia lowei]
MSTIFSFQSQLVSIMDALSKTAVLEISKLVEIESKMLKIEITRGRNEISSLTEKLQLMENLLWVAQGRRQDTTARSEIVTDTHKKSSDGIQHPKAISDRQPVFTERFVTTRTRSSMAEPERRETRWDPPALSEFQAAQLPPAHTNPEAGKSLGRNVASQSSGAPKNMKIHSLRNSAAKRFGCLQCGKSFRCFSQLEIHQRSHTGEKPFRCTLCGKRYAQKGHLYTHQRTHTGEKPYRCAICGKGFIQKCTLDMHQRTHTGEKPFVCVKCGKGFTKNCNLKKHLAP